MQQPHPGFFVDDAVPNRILDIVRDATEYLTLVSPYVDVTGHLEQQLRLAVERGVRLLIVVRRDPDDTLGGRNGKEALSRLASLGAHVKAVDNLHAKIYLSESAIVVSSMNLLKSSWSNSLEFGMEVPEGPEGDNVRAYVWNTLVKLGTDVSPHRSPGKPSSARKPRRTAKKAVAEERKTYRTKKKKPVREGHCIRCGTSIALDPSRPLCADCYEVWSHFSNEEYAEQVCHACGEEHDTTYAKPLCRRCYRRLAS